MARCDLWFGTLDRMGWFPTPLAGAEMSPDGWSAEENLLNGGAFVRNSWGTHKTYVFEWRDTSARQVAQLMKSYRDGTYGRGLIYFLDPLIYDMNILPARWADPSMAIGYEGVSLVYGVEPEAVPTSGGDANMLPSTSAYYNLTNIEHGYRDDRDSVFIPTPPGYRLRYGAFYQTTGSAGVFATTVNSNGTLGSTQTLIPVDNSFSESIVPGVTTPGGKGVRLWVGKSSAGAASITLSALILRLEPIGGTVNLDGPWIGGMGHSGCSFSGVPTYVANSGHEGGRIGFAASFTEVGDWL